MMKLALRTVAVLAASASLACGADIPGLSFVDSGVLSGGYSGTGFASSGQKLDPQFRYLYFNDAVPEGRWTCDTDGYCGLGGIGRTFGTLASADSILFVSTANFTRSPRDVVVIASGVETKNSLSLTNPSQYKGLRLVLDWAFLSARLAPATHNDSAIVRLKSGTDSATIFKFSAADLQSGKVAQKTGGCGQASVITGRPITYASCTDWQTSTVDLSTYLARTFVLQFIVAEGGQSLSDHVDQPSAFLFRHVRLEVGR